MNNKILIISISAVIGGIVLLVGSFFIGVFLQAQKTAPRIEEASKIIKLVNSKLILTIITNGKITNISERTITLSNEGESFAVFVKENAEISSVVFSENEEGKNGSSVGPVQKRIEFKDIKIGDYANVSLEILPEGELKAKSVIVYPGFPEISS